MDELVSRIFIEDIIVFAMRQRNKPWDPCVSKTLDMDPDTLRIFTPAIGEAVMNFAENGIVDYKEVLEDLLELTLQGGEGYYGRFLSNMKTIGKDCLQYEDPGFVFAYCALIVNVCFYCHEKGHMDLINAAIIAAGMALQKKLTLSRETDPEIYQLSAVQYNLKNAKQT